MNPEPSAAGWTALTFLGYILLVYGIAAFAHHVSKGKSFLKEYFLGSRSLGPWTLALTFAATSASGGSFAGFPSLIYTYGWVLALWIAGYMVFPICTMGFLGKRINQVAKKCDAVTLPDIFRDRYNSPWLGLLTAFLIIFYLVVYLIAQFKAGGVLIQTLMKDLAFFQGISGRLEGVASLFEGVSSGYLAGLLLFTTSVVLYTAYGGFRAVVLTDVMQGIIMGLGVIILLPLTLHTAYVYLDPPDLEPAPLVEVESRREARSEEPFRLTQFSQGLRKVGEHLKQEDPSAMSAPGHKKTDDMDGEDFKPFLPLGLAISFFFLWPISGSGQAGNMLRLMAFQNTKTLARAIFAVTIYYGFIYIPLVIIFVCAKTLPLSVEQSDQAMPAMAMLVAPPLLAGLLIAAPFAAIMSTVDSFLLMISSALVRDIYQRAINPDVSERAIRIASLATTLAVGFLVLLLTINPPQFLQDIIVFGSAGQAATFLGAMVLTLYWPRSNAAGTASAMITGFVVVAGLYTIGRLQTGEFVSWAPYDIHPFIWGLIGSFIGGVLGSLATPPPSERTVARFFYASDHVEPSS
ncbi:MAG: sodium transporter [Candidatus Omnitrophica bacterium]|nr:sodium transporter [Candidatus Omnitrophota bacterium]